MSANKGHALVTGGAGLIGSHIVDLLIEKGYEVTILDNLDGETHPKGKPKWLNPSARFLQGDVRNDADIRKALQGIRFVFHQAAFGGFTEKVSHYVDVNVGGTARIFEQLATGKFSVEKMVVASSQAIYAEGAYECGEDGAQFPPVRLLAQLRKKEWDPLCPKCGKRLKPSLTSEEKLREGETPYALTKEFEERLALSCGKQLGLPVVGLRYAVTYGPRQSVFNPYTGVVSVFSTRILNNLAPVVYEDGEQTRDFIFAGDVAKANLVAMESDKANFQVFNVGTGKANSIATLARCLSSIYGKTIEPDIRGEFRIGDVRHILLNASKLRQLGFSASVDLSEGLSRFAEWIKVQGPVEEYFTRAYDHLKRKRIVSNYAT